MKLIRFSLNQRNPILLGFFISLLGALPLGYINVISLQILIEQGNFASIAFIMGIVIIQFIVLKIVSRIAVCLVQQKQIIFLIDLFTILFLLGIASYFIFDSHNQQQYNVSNLAMGHYPLLLGLLLNSINFIQWPYWSGIYVYLFRSNKLKLNDTNLFSIGAILGTTAGMLAFAYVTQYLIIENQIELSRHLNPIFTLLFLSLGIIQTLKLIWKSSPLIAFKFNFRKITK